MLILIYVMPSVNKHYKAIANTPILYDNAILGLEKIVDSFHIFYNGLMAFIG